MSSKNFELTQSILTTKAIASLNIEDDLLVEDPSPEIVKALFSQSVSTLDDLDKKNDEFVETCGGKTND